MRFGSAEIQLISDGSFRVDGGAVFGGVPKAIWSKLVPVDSKNRVELGLNCLLIRSGGKNVLVDTGLGSKHNRKQRSTFQMQAGNLIARLSQAGLRPDDIDLVVLTHLHFDHAGGCTRYSPGGSPVPNFPKAAHLVQRQDWVEATETNDRTRRAYLPDDFLPLDNTRQLELLDGDTELLPGLWARRTGGHTAGHQVVCIESDGERAACLGDLIPIPQHLPAHYATACDLYPLETLQAKRSLLAQAENDRWLLIFGHGAAQKSGYLRRDDRRWVLDPCPLEVAASPSHASGEAAAP